MVRFAFLLGLMVTVYCIPARAQTDKSDFEFITSANHSLELSPQRAPNFFDSKQRTELVLFASSVIRFYQLFISSQDAPVCNFSPSCSRYAMLAMQKTSFLKAFLLSGDRLLRCTGMSFKLHPPDPSTGLYPDPVEDYLHYTTHDH